MKIRVALALLFSIAVVAFSQSGGWVRYFQLYSGDRRGNGSKIQMATGTPATGALAVYDANGNVAPTLVGTEGQVVTSVSGVPTYVTPAASVAIPTGAVMPFNLTSCPSGWSDYTAASGRYIVGLPSGGTLAGTTGTALTNAENRAVGQHNHTGTTNAHLHTLPSLAHTHSITDPGHAHNEYSAHNDSVASGSGTDIYQNTTTKNSATTSSTTGISVASASPGIGQTESDLGISFTTANSGSVAGTNAPYIQLRMCSKN